MIKKLLLILISITVVNLCYASFPFSDDLRNKIVYSTDSEDPDWIENLFGINFDNGKIPPLSVFILPWLIPLLLFYLIRGYKRDVDWIRKLIRWKNIWWLLLLIALLVLVGLSGIGSGMGG
tara:strand:- start:76 stop:438 length:363 start_codon:yes stop_codon:yes gene_type:complete